MAAVVPQANAPVAALPAPAAADPSTAARIGSMIWERIPYRDELIYDWPMVLLQGPAGDGKRSPREISPELFFNTGVPNSNPNNPPAMPIDPRLIRGRGIPVVPQDPIFMGPTDIPMDNPYLDSTGNPYIRDIVYAPTDSRVYNNNIDRRAYATNNYDQRAYTTTNNEYNEYVDNITNNNITNNYLNDAYNTYNTENYDTANNSTRNEYNTTYNNHNVDIDRSTQVNNYYNPETGEPLTDEEIAEVVALEEAAAYEEAARAANLKGVLAGAGIGGALGAGVGYLIDGGKGAVAGGLIGAGAGGAVSPYLIRKWQEQYPLKKSK